MNVKLPQIYTFLQNYILHKSLNTSTFLKKICVEHECFGRRLKAALCTNTEKTHQYRLSIEH